MSSKEVEVVDNVAVDFDSMVNIRLKYVEGRKGLNQEGILKFPKDAEVFKCGQSLLVCPCYVFHSTRYKFRKTSFSFSVSKDPKNPCYIYELSFRNYNGKTDTYTETTTTKLIKAAFGEKASVSCPQLFLYGCPIVQLIFGLMKAKPADMDIDEGLNLLDNPFAQTVQEPSSSEVDDDEENNYQIILDCLKYYSRLKGEAKKDFKLILRGCSISNTSSTRLIDDHYKSTIKRVAPMIIKMFETNFEGKDIQLGDCSWSKPSGRKRKKGSESPVGDRIGLRKLLMSFRAGTDGRLEYIEEDEDDTFSGDEDDGIEFKPNQIAWYQRNITSNFARPSKRIRVFAYPSKEDIERAREYDAHVDELAVNNEDFKQVFGRMNDSVELFKLGIPLQLK